MPAVFLRDNEAKEPLVLDVLPRLGGKVAALPDLPIVGHRAELLHRAVHERLFFVRETRVVGLQELFEIRLAGEQFAFQPHRATVDGFLLGLRDNREEVEGFHRLHHAQRQHTTNGRNQENN